MILEEKLMRHIKFPKKQIPIAESFDVLVAGAGMAGVAAAISAARSGLKTGLIEYFGCPGGVPTSGLLGSISSFWKGSKQVVGGIGLEIIDRLKKERGVIDNYKPRHYICDPEKLTAVLLGMLIENKINTYFYTQIIDGMKEDSVVKYAIVASKSSIQAFPDKIFIDGTGDGDLAAYTGCPYKKGRDSDGFTQSATLVFKIAGIDRQVAPSLREIDTIWQERNTSKIISQVVMKYLPRPENYPEAVINMTHILKFDSTSNTELTRARFEGTKQAYQILSFFKKNVHGFKNSYISQTATQIGVRESRRFIGDYILTEEDVVNYKSFDDEVVRGSWGIDIHNPIGIHTGIERELTSSYGIPYRCLTPHDVDNLFCIGRCISATHRALSSCRISATCIGTGQAAGCAAKFAIESGGTRKINIKKLQIILEQQNVIIDK